MRLGRLLEHTCIALVSVRVDFPVLDGVLHRATVFVDVRAIGELAVWHVACELDKMNFELIPKDCRKVE
jgi:hypothetical protein